ncbi:MAG TPA: M48 family metallopeptidase [Planctomycetota bacterium]|jgi:Zn-dependent protease with chaperone function
MRIPFDLIAAIFCAEGVGRYLDLKYHGTQPAFMSSGRMMLSWLGLLLVAWLSNELVVRDVEWRTRFGFLPSGYKTRSHPLVTFNRMTLVAQALTVGLYSGILYLTQWPLWVMRWPAWLGIYADAKLAHLRLSDSMIASVLLNTGPFLLAMLISWLPRRRLISGIRGRKVPLWAYLSSEARLTWLPLVLVAFGTVIRDVSEILPKDYTEWSSRPGIDILLTVLSMGALWTIGLPQLVIWVWQCKPLPDGELKDRLVALAQRSGVKAREILVWGSRESALLNACVLGAWSRYRYVLISPALVDELGLEETEAVLAHELGHARYGHLSLLFVLMLCISAVISPVLDALPENWRQSPLAQGACALALLVFSIRVFYGTIMRQCEREADLASAELMGTPRPLVNALERLAMITGNIRKVWSWHHGSTAERVEAVTRLSGDPVSSRRFHARLRWLRIALTLLTVAVLGVELFVKL